LGDYPTEVIDRWLGGVSHVTIGLWEREGRYLSIGDSKEEILVIVGIMNTCI